MKKAGKPITPFHTSKTKKPGGDHFGSGVKNPMARMVDNEMPKISNKKLGKPPKSLA